MTYCHVTHTHNMLDVEKINRKDLSQLANAAGFKGGVAAMCRKLKISRNTAYEAVDNPARYPLAFPKIQKALRHAQIQSN